MNIIAKAFVFTLALPFFTSNAWSSDSSNMMWDQSAPVASCVEGRISVTYDTSVGTATIEVWSNGFPMRCSDTNDINMFSSIDGIRLSLSEARDMILAAVHQHLIVREAALYSIDGGWFNEPLPQVTAQSMSQTLRSIGDVSVDQIAHETQ